ncbi:glycosyltransferase family 4 protein [Pengzhenrongella sp.]|uniref:glycosyltransferase family 4 protein n=1 Tax=Pengzhenrongella sp. TaxID=2888820 RepID=UPI002F947824
MPSGRWQSANFEAPEDLVPSGLVEADPVLAAHFPEETRAMWRRAASFHLVVTGTQRARHPASLRLMFGVLNWIRTLNPDILHIDDVDVSPRLALALAVTRLPCPVVVGCHDPEPHSGEQDWRVKSLTRTLLLSRADAVLVHHEAGRAALRLRHRRLRAPVYTVRLASYTFLQHGIPSTEITRSAEPAVLLFGRITQYKGLDTLFLAAPIVAHEVPGVRFLVAGKPADGYQPPEPPPLPNGGRIETTYGYISNDRTAALFREAQVVVCPYTDASQSGVVLTAYAFGRPVVVTDVGGLPEYVRDGVTGLVVPAGDHEALAAAVIRCLREPGLAASLRDGVATANATDLSWRRVGSELTEIYAEVAGRARGRGLRSRLGRQR